MALDFAPTEADSDVLVDINTTPLIDVMLVLLIMLIITLPIQLHVVNINNPVGKPPPPTVPPEVVRLEIAANNNILWNGEQLADLPALNAKLSGAAGQAVPPELHVRSDKDASYRTLVAVMSSVQRNGLKKVGIVGNEQWGD